MTGFLVIITCNREVERVIAVGSLERALAIGNYYILKRVNSYLTPMGISENVGHGVDWYRVDGDHLRGWCNYGGLEYDVHVVPAPVSVSKPTRVWRVIGYHGYSDYDGPEDNNIDFTLEVDGAVSKEEVEEIVRKRYQNDRVLAFHVQEELNV